MSNITAKKLLKHYLDNTLNSNPRLNTLSEDNLLVLAERALHHSGSWHVQFERLLMETKTDM